MGDLLDNGLPDRSLPKGGSSLGGIAGTGNQRIRKKTLSGLARALDDRCVQIDRWGDPHMGMPEDALGHIIYCAYVFKIDFKIILINTNENVMHLFRQFVYSGLYALIYMTIRYPLKIIQKGVLYTGTIGHIISYANRCLNPITILDFVSAGKRHNSHLQRMAQFKHQIKQRFIFVADKARHEDRQMFACWY